MVDATVEECNSWAKKSATTAVERANVMKKVFYEEKTSVPSLPCRTVVARFFCSCVLLESSAHETKTKRHFSPRSTQVGDILPVNKVKSWFLSSRLVLFFSYRKPTPLWFVLHSNLSKSVGAIFSSCRVPELKTMRLRAFARPSISSTLSALWIGRAIAMPLFCTAFAAFVMSWC